MSDLTMKSKQELIQAMNAGIISTNAKDVYSCGFRNGIRWCRALLEDDPPTPNFEDASQYAQPEQRWIPVSEELPKVGKEVLLSEPNMMFIAEYCGSGDSKGLWLVDGYHHFLADVNGCAWMPLPEPYQEGE